MKEIKKEIEDFKKNISKVEDQNYKELFDEISKVSEGLSNKVQEILVNEAVLAENFKDMNDDISGLQDELFEEVSLEELDQMEDEYKEVNCKSCGKPIYIEASALTSGEKISCPYCNKEIM